MPAIVKRSQISRLAKKAPKVATTTAIGISEAMAIRLPNRSSFGYLQRGG